ncbi:UNVERIFIED_ORG: hypothetical protein B2H98_17465, partial [Clostridium botulinum]
NSDLDITSCKIDEIKASSSGKVTLNRPVTIEKITSLIDNENDKINVKGIGTVKNIEEKFSGSIILDKNIITDNSSEETGDEKNPVITSSRDLENLQSNAQYETIILNIKDIFEKVELNDIKTKKLIIKNANYISLKRCIINKLQINANESDPSITADKLSKIENVDFESSAYFEGSKIKNIYVNTSERVGINCEAENIEVLKKGSDVSIRNLKNEIGEILVKEESSLSIANVNLKSLVILKDSNVRVRDSIVNSIEIFKNSDLDITSCKIDEIKASSSGKVTLNRPVTIEKIKSLIDNENDKINVKGIGTVKNIEEKVNGSIKLDKNIITGNSSEESGDEKNPVITSSKDLEKLQSNAQYETITLNIKDVFEKVELKNIKTKKLIVKNANSLYLEECTINELEVNANESKPNIEADKLSKIENVSFESNGYFEGSKIKNIYVNTSERVGINCEAENIEVLKKGSDVSIRNLKNEIGEILVKEETSLSIANVNLKSLVILKDSNVRVRDSIVNSIEIFKNSDLDITSCKIDEIKASSSGKVTLNRPVTIEKITSLIDNENDKITIKGYGTVNSIYEKINGSVALGENVDEKDKEDRSAKLVSSDDCIEDTELTTTNKDLIEEESTINNENLILEENDTKNVLDSEDKVSEIKYNEVVKPNSDINEKNTNNINATSKDESKTSNTNVILEDNSIK